MPLKAVMRIIGDGPLRRHLEAEAQELGIGAAVEFLGAQGDMLAIYRSLDVVVLPSLREGMPLVVLEAMACGKPVIASRVGAVTDIIDDTCGILVNAGDVAALTEALQLCVADSALLVRLAAAGRRRVIDGYSVELQANLYLSTYERASRRRVA